MTIEQTNVLDFVGVDSKTDQVIMFISDHLEWEKDEIYHMSVLQDKIDSYVRSIESGEIYEIYPKAAGREFLIRVVAMHPPSEEAKAFFDRIRSILLDTGYKIEFEHHPFEFSSY